MSDAFPLHPGEPLGVWLAEPRASGGEGLREVAFELSSRGDRVPGRLLLPAAAPSRHPLVLLTHGAGGSRHADYIDAAALPWVRGGAAVATIDLPLHGARHSGKLTQRFLDALGFEPRPGGGVPSGLWRELAHQAVADLRRTLDALATHPEIDAGRVAFAGFSLGAILGAYYCGVDSRLRAAALALAGGGFGSRELDPARWIARFQGPTLFVAARRDERVPAAATQALFEAARDPKQLLWFESGHSDLPGEALKAMWQFLQEHLGLAPAPPEDGAAPGASRRSRAPASRRG